MNSITQKEIDRFWGHVDKESSTTFYNGSRCWEWIASKNKKGYGSLGIFGKHFLAHRLSYKLSYGDIPENLGVLHHCDNRACVNPQHLFLGDQKDNMKDMIQKGRNQKYGIRGEKHYSHKLTEKQVEDIRKEYTPGIFGFGMHRLAKKYGVGKATIRSIIRNETWKK